jgi:hypothetical protein
MNIDIVFNKNKFNRFFFFNSNLSLTELKYFNSDRLVFSDPIEEKIPNNIIPFKRIFVAATGPKPRNVTEDIRDVYDVDELFDYDYTVDIIDTFSKEEKKTLDKSTINFEKSYNFEKLTQSDYHVLINFEWYKNTMDADLKEPSFLYNMNANIYKVVGVDDDVVTTESILRSKALPKFTVFDGSSMVKNNPALLAKIPLDQYHILIKASWLKNKMHKKWLKCMSEDIRPLVFSSEEVFTFGLAQNKLDEKSTNTSYQISLCLYNQNKKNYMDADVERANSEVRWATKYDELAMMCRKYVSTKFPKLRNLANNMKGLTWKDDNIDDGPKLYPKIMFKQFRNREIQGEFVTVFEEKAGDSDEDNIKIEDPLTIVDKRGVITASLKFESIFIGTTMALQVRVNDVLISKWIQPLKPRALITRKKTSRSSSPAKSSESSDSDSSDEEDPQSAKNTQALVKRNIKTIKVAS